MKARRKWLALNEFYSGGRIRTSGLRVMSPTNFNWQRMAENPWETSKNPLEYEKPRALILVALAPISRVPRRAFDSEAPAPDVGLRSRRLASHQRLGITRLRRQVSKAG